MHIDIRITTLKDTKSVPPRLLSHLPPEMLGNEHDAAFFKAANANLLHENFQLYPSQCKYFRRVEYKICMLHYLK